MPTPSGVVTLCRNALVPRDYSHTIDFKDPSEQLAYWGLLTKYRVPDVRYVRKDRAYIVVDYSLDELQDVNYLYFKSKEDSKMYYCFVDDKVYNNEHVTYIYFTVDVLQTYMFDYKFNQSYVLQEHIDRWTADHKPIYSRTDEGLNYGDEYTVESAYRIKETSLEKPIRWYLVVAKDHKELIMEGASGEPTNIIGHNMPYVLYLVPEGDYGNWAVQLTADKSSALGDMAYFSALMDRTELGNYIVQISRLNYLPFNFKIGTNSSGVLVVDVTSESDIECDVTQLGKDNLYSWFIKIKSIGRNFNFTNKLAEMGIFEGIESAMPTAEQWAEIKSKPYTTARDKRYESKLLCYPYRYNLLTDGKNQPALIKNEYIGSDKIKVNYTQVFSFNSPARYWLEGYRKDPEGRDNSIMQLVAEDQPVINDQYYTYMLQNKNQIQANQTNAVINTVSNVAQNVIGGAIFGGPAGAISSGVGGAVNGAISYQAMIRSENAKQKDLRNLPDTIINSNDCLFNNVDENRYINFYRYKICCEFEEQLADTFNMQGYTVKRMKVPNLKSRVRFNYIKTVGANIVGSFDQNMLDQIKAIYNNGVTIWHYNTTNFKMYDYSLENIERSLL